MAGESKTEMSGVRLTGHEKAALRFYVAARQTTESEFIRDRLGLDGIVAEYERALAVSRDTKPAA